MSEAIPFGKYTLVEHLATGAVAELYRATTRTADGSQVAVVIKRIRDDLARDPAFAGSFMDEAKLSAALSHPNIARVYEWGRADEALYIAMEYIEGTNLGSLMQSASEQGVRFQPTVGLYILGQVLDGLAFAHELTDPFGHPLGLVHRNVCPRNIVLASDGRVKLVDFGLARASTRTAATRPGVFAGGLTYLAPEVIAQRETDHRADLFSVGVVLYEVLTGRKLHAETGPEAVRQVAETVRAYPPSSMFADIPKELDQLIVRATSPDPGQRPATARVLREALLAFLGKWDRQVDPDGLSAYLVEVLSGRAQKASGRASFAFGEATSHWFNQGEALEKLEPGEALPAEALPPRPVDSTDPVLRAPRGGFAAGSTVMAVEEGGLGRSRTWKALAIVGGVLVVVGVLVWAAIHHLTSAPEVPKGPQPALDTPVEAAFSGPVVLKVQPAAVLAFVDGDPATPEGDPPALLGLRAGERHIRLVAAGHLPWEGVLTLVKDQPAEIAQNLEPRKGVLQVQVDRPRAAVFLDGKKVGLTPKAPKAPLEIKGVSGAQRHTLRVELRGFAPDKRELKPEDWPEDPEAPWVIDVSLQKPGKKPPAKKTPARKPARSR